MTSSNANIKEALERIRPYKMNAFNGERIVSDLEAHPELWEEVWMNWDENADSLYISTSTWDDASRLLEIAFYWRSDGIEANERSDGRWQVGGWWD